MRGCAIGTRPTRLQEERGGGGGPEPSGQMGARTPFPLQVRPIAQPGRFLPLEGRAEGEQEAGAAARRWAFCPFLNSSYYYHLIYIHLYIPLPPPQLRISRFSERFPYF